VSEGGQKRPPPPPPLEQERSKRINVERENTEDEDWLRYSPPPAAEVVVAETTISRFASEIQGDCVPITAPNGERVYAKLGVDGLVGGLRGTRQGAQLSNPNHSHKG
jgi:chromosome transmission fidelity protein 18